MKTNNAKTKNRPVGSLDFKRTAYYFEDNKTLVLVYYEGDETVYVPTHHGNSKKTASEFARTAPSVLRRTPKQLKTPTVKTPCTGKRLRFSDKQADIQPISPRFTCPLPVKKRKLSMQNFSDKTPWVSGLTLEHKNKILTNTWLCSDIINTCTDIVQTQFPGIAGFQATTLAPRSNENTKSWTQDFGTFQSKQAPCVQIHHTGKSHWVTSLQQTRDTTVYVLDSLNSLHTIEIQLAAIYGDKKKKTST
ncbi:Hypothetical predicted protein [Mytilus galloprovincialis]|uniref:Ubiquitin-like protease family profile domain-containing protein n=1 Tax=Mytilus galloprovincialis TaxID=29158 RepID=A0A8B6GS93_MYTGA|nr:Hypothetical predicted protein [Mytilus galloprovincialis]